jgi:hypothetical protein
VIIKSLLFDKYSWRLRATAASALISILSVCNNRGESLRKAIRDKHGPSFLKVVTGKNLLDSKSSHGALALASSFEFQSLLAEIIYRVLPMNQILRLEWFRKNTIRVPETINAESVVNQFVQLKSSDFHQVSYI